MKNNIVKLIIGIFATGTVATTSAVITTKVVENKENKMAEKQNNNIVVQNISGENEIENQSEEINNEIENKVGEENTTNEGVENNQPIVTASTNYNNKTTGNQNLDKDKESNNVSGKGTEVQKELMEYNKAKQEAWKEGKDLYFSEFDAEYKKQQTQPTPEPSTSTEAESTDGVE